MQVDRNRSNKNVGVYILIRFLCVGGGGGSWEKNLSSLKTKKQVSEVVVSVYAHTYLHKPILASFCCLMWETEINICQNFPIPRKLSSALIRPGGVSDPDLSKGLYPDPEKKSRVDSGNNNRSVPNKKRERQTDKQTEKRTVKKWRSYKESLQ